MKVEEVVPSSLPTTTKLALIISKDDSASSSSDGADSGCLAETPEYGKEDDSLCHSDVCVTPDMARRDRQDPLLNQQQNDRKNEISLSEMNNSSHIHSKSSSTTSDESSGNLGSEEWVSGFPARVVTSYLEINCNKNDVTSENLSPKSDTNSYYCINSRTSNDNNNICHNTDDDNNRENPTICNTNNDTIDQRVCNDNKTVSSSNSTEELSDTNSNDSLKPPLKCTESQSNSGTEELSSQTTTNTSSISEEIKPTVAPAIVANANCSHEITLSLSQLSDFEVTKQKIKEMRKSFLTNLPSEELHEAPVITQQNSVGTESSFLAHLQNKRANRLKLKRESQKPTTNISGDCNPHRHVELCENLSSNHFSYIPENRILRDPNSNNVWQECDSYSSATTSHSTHNNEVPLPKVTERCSTNLDFVNANTPFNIPSSSLPPSVTSSPLHCAAGTRQYISALTASSPCSPLHCLPNISNCPTHVPNKVPLELVSKSKFGQCYGECLSRSADLKTYSTENTDLNRQYLRTRSLEEGSKLNNKPKSRSPVSSIRRVFSHHRSSKSGVSPSDNKGNLSQFGTDESLNGDHTYENSNFVEKLSNRNSCKVKGSNSENSNVWLLEKTAQLLRLKKYGNKNKGAKRCNEFKSDSDSEQREQKGKLRDACKDVARALFSLPNSPERTRETRSQSPPPSLILCPRVAPHSTAELERDLSLSRQVRRRQHLISAAESSPRNSYHDTCCCPPGSCQCPDYRCNGYKCPPEGLQRSPAFFDGWQKLSPLINRPNSDPNITEIKRKEKIIETVRRNKKCDDNELTSSEDDYAEDYCQTDECGDDCDYCSGDDAGDEEDDICDQCPTGGNGVSSVCKHSRVLSNGIMRPYGGKGRIVREGGVDAAGRMPVDLTEHHKQQQQQRSMLSATTSVVPAATVQLQQSHPRRRRSAASSSCTAAAASARQHSHGLGAIRESSATSDDQLDTDEEQFSHDGSNCDLSKSWRFGLTRDTIPSRDSTLCSDSSAVSVDHIRLFCKEKSNSLPGAYTRPLPTYPPKERPGSTLLRVGSTSEEESVISVSSSCNPTRPPRVPRTRCPSSPNPPIPPILPSPASPRPTMGIQCLQRSPNMSRALHVSGLPTSPRIFHSPRTVAPRSPNNPNPPYGFSQVTPEYAPQGSPRTSSRAGGLVTRNFSISDDENGRRCPRRQVTISRHETAYKEAAEKGYVLPPGSPVDPYWLTWVSTKYIRVRLNDFCVSPPLGPYFEVSSLGGFISFRLQFGVTF